MEVVWIIFASAPKVWHLRVNSEAHRECKVEKEMLQSHFRGVPRTQPWIFEPDDHDKDAIAQNVYIVCMINVDHFNGSQVYIKMSKPVFTFLFYFMNCTPIEAL